MVFVMSRKILLLLFLFFLFGAQPAEAEIYQYKDPTGTSRFTDDLSNVPEEQRPDLKTFKSVKNDEDKRTKLQNSMSSSKASERKSSTTADTWREKVENSSRELEQMKADLEQRVKQLRKQRKQLKANTPAKNSSSREKAAYYDKIKSLNAKIEAYSKQREKFQKKIDAFNRLVGAK